MQCAKMQCVKTERRVLTPKLARLPSTFCRRRRPASGVTGRIRSDETSFEFSAVIVACRYYLRRRCFIPMRNPVFDRRLLYIRLFVLSMTLVCALHSQTRSELRASPPSDSAPKVILEVMNYHFTM